MLTVGRRLGALIGLALLMSSTVVYADARTDYLLRLLQTSSTFRVRAQAALSLGGIAGDPKVVQALGDALGDKHPAVRVAAAAALERLGDPEALQDLRVARRDKDASVRRAINRAITKLERIARTRPRREQVAPRDALGDDDEGPSRFYVGVGTPGSGESGIRSRELNEVREFLASEIDAMDGVVVAPRRENHGQAAKVLKKRRLSGYYVDSSIVRVEDNGTGTRAVVSVILNTYPGRDIRAMLQGAATVPGGRGPEARRQAIEGAFRGALRRLPQAMDASEARAER